MNDSSQSNFDDEQLPQEVVAALRGRHGPQTRIPESLDKAVLDDASQHLKTISQPVPVHPSEHRRRWIAVSTGTLAAAVLLFAVWPQGVNETQQNSDTLTVQNHEVTDFAGSRLVAAEDVDRNGEINILDAFTLARVIESDSASGSQWDQNGDGRADQDDVRLVALRAVML